jgi:hypothetical protein
LNELCQFAKRQELPAIRQRFLQDVELVHSQAGVKGRCPRISTEAINGQPPSIHHTYWKNCFSTKNLYPSLAKIYWTNCFSA